jgi:hypothetical protein
MTDRITLVVRFRIAESVKGIFLTGLGCRFREVAPEAHAIKPLF